MSLIRVISIVYRNHTPVEKLCWTCFYRIKDTINKGHLTWPLWNTSSAVMRYVINRVNLFNRLSNSSHNSSTMETIIHFDIDSSLSWIDMYFFIFASQVVISRLFTVHHLSRRNGNSRVNGYADPLQSGCTGARVALIILGFLSYIICSTLNEISWTRSCTYSIETCKQKEKKISYFFSVRSMEGPGQAATGGPTSAGSVRLSFSPPLQCTELGRVWSIVLIVYWWILFSLDIYL